MARSERTSPLAIPLTVRSSDVTADCDMRTFLGLMHEDKYHAAWNYMGTALHMSFEAALNGASYTEAGHVALDYFDHCVVAYGPTDDWLFSKDRGLEEIPDLMEAIFDSFWENVIDPDTRHLTFAGDYEWLPEYRVVTPDINTQIDAVRAWRSADHDQTYDLFDWKTGKSDRHDARQMQFYWGALEYDLGLEVETAEFVTVKPDGIKFQSVDKPSELWYRQAKRLAQIRKEEKLFPASPGWYCNYCEFKPECPVWTPSLEGKVTKLLERSYTE